MWGSAPNSLCCTLCRTAAAPDGTLNPKRKQATLPILAVRTPEAPLWGTWGTFLVARFATINVCRNAFNGSVLSTPLETSEAPLAVTELWDRKIVVPKEQRLRSQFLQVHTFAGSIVFCGDVWIDPRSFCQHVLQGILKDPHLSELWVRVLK